MAIIVNREVGKLSLSIGTSLAIEGIMGIHEGLVLQRPYPLYTADHIWINVRTLIRNIYGSMTKELKYNSQYVDYQETLFAEMHQIVDLINRETNGRAWVNFYYPSHRSLTSRYPHAALKNDNSKNGNALKEIERWIMDGSYTPMPFQVEQINLDINLQGVNKLLVLTHQTLDLLHIKGCSNIGLVESHTGVVKDSHRWYTKLKGCSKEPRIPFNHVTIQIFGDSGDELQPANIRLRSELIELAEKAKWTQNTSVTQMVRSANSLAKTELRELINMLA